MDRPSFKTREELQLFLEQKLKEQMERMCSPEHRRHVLEMNVFLRHDLHDLLDAEPPKTEPAVPQPDLQIVNPYVPLAHRK